MSSLADDPELRRYFTRDELIAHERQQREDLARFAVRREVETASTGDIVSKLDTLIAEAILAPLGLRMHDEMSESKLARLFAGLVCVQRMRGTVRGSDFEESDRSVFSAAAELARIPVEDALGLPAEVRARMRAMVV